MNDNRGLPVPGDVVAGKYRIQHALGTGGMGAVFRATQLVTGRPVALKCLRPRTDGNGDAVARLMREARASARVQHANVVRIYDVVEEQGTPWLVLELLEGQTLRERLRARGGRLSVRECLAIMLPVLRGVSAAHAEGVVHRDIKPDNIFLARGPDGTVPKVFDFGISKIATDSPLAEGTLTATGATLGTPHYMSLEQLQGIDVDGRADVYATGVVLYECLTGRRPFESESFAAIVVKVATEDPPDPLALCPELTPPLRDVLLRAMARHREDRHESAAALLAALQPFLPQAQDLAASVAVAGLPVQRADIRVPLGHDAPDLGTAPSSDPAKGSVAPPATQTADAMGRSPLQKRSAAAAVHPRLRPALLALGTILGLAGAAAVAWSGWRGTTGQAPAVAAPQSDSARVSGPSAAGPSSPGVARPSASQAPSPRALAVDKGADGPAAESASTAGFSEGWVYLGDHDSRTWRTRYFDGWQGDGHGNLPRPGAVIHATGRSHVRSLAPDAEGRLGGVRAIVGPGQRLQVLDVVRWLGGRYVWARVKSHGA